MKNTNILIVIIIFSVIFGFIFLACDSDTPDLPASKITLTNATDLNGKYVAGWFFVSHELSLVFGASAPNNSHFIQGVQVANGTVTMNVYKTTDWDWSPSGQATWSLYTGNDIVDHDFSHIFYKLSGQTVDIIYNAGSDVGYCLKTGKTVNFSNGVATVNFDDLEIMD